MQKTYKNILRHFWDFLLASQILSSLQQRAGNPTAVHVQKSCVSKHMLNCSWFVWCYGFQNQQKLAWIPKNSAEKYARASFADLVSSIRYTCEAVFRLGFYTLYLLSLELTPACANQVLAGVFKKPARMWSVQPLSLAKPALLMVLWEENTQQLDRKQSVCGCMLRL